MKKNDSLVALRLFASVAARRKLAILALLSCALPLTLAQGAKLKEARVTQVVRDVKLLPSQAAPRPATISDQIREGTAVRTGLESRAELTFTDATLARLGANTIFSFDQGTRNLDLGGGAMLLRVPKNSGGAQINTAAITAAITGTTMLLEYHPNAYCKYIMLEGVARIFRNNKVGESVLLHPGQMLIVNPNGKGLPEPVDVDLERLMKTSILITGFDPLPSLDLIAHSISEQDAQKKEGGLLDTNLVLYNGTIVSLLDPTNSTTADQANSNEMRQAMLSPTASPTVTPTITPTITPTVTPTISPTVTPTPSKFGTPTVISSPVPYVIGSGTTITTDPSITTNGVTDFGKLYRGSALDGSASIFLFGSTSAFDTEISFDERIDDPNTLPGAAFKFTALQLAGNPTVSLDNGGVANLGLISVGDLTSAAPGGVLTFDGIDALLLATENGSITLGSEISFEGISRLFLYARGAGSTLTLDSTISGATDLTMISEGEIIFNEAFDLTESGALDRGLHFDALTGTNLVANNGLTITLDNSSGGDTLEESARILLSTDQDLTANGEPGLNLTISNNAGGHIGGAASIEVFPNGNLNAFAVNLLINDRDGGSIEGDANILFDVGGALNIDNDMTLVISTRNDGLGGGTIGSTAFLDLQGASISTGGLIDLAISANAGGLIPSATLNAIVSGDVVANGGYFSEIQSTGFNVPDGPFIQGGMITGNASLMLTFGSMTSGDVFDVEIDNFGAGTIGGEALLSVGITGDLNAASDIVTDIINTAANHNGVLSPGGTIDGDATVSVSVGGDIIAGGVDEFAVLNNDLNLLSEAGTIMGSALVSLSATNLTTGGFFQPLINNTNGTIGGSATVFVNATGDINVGAETLFNILNSNGTIGGPALSSLIANNFSSGSTFEFQILNGGGIIGASATLTAALTGKLSSVGDSTIQIQNADFTGSVGSIGGDATVSLIAGDINVVGDAQIQIDNSDLSFGGGGAIGGTATVTVSANNLVAQSLSANVFNDGGSIGSDAVVDLLFASAATASNSFGSSLNLDISNNGAGSIGGNALVTLNVAGAVTAESVTFITISNGDNGLGGGVIDGNAAVAASAGSISITGSSFGNSFGTFIENHGGNILGAASIDLSVAGDFSALADASFQIFNNPILSSPGTIGSDATLTLNASSFFAGSLRGLIDNTGATIGGAATLDINVAGSLTIGGDATIQISNAGGSIGQDATIDFNLGSFSANSLLLQIDNTGGTIGGTSNINFVTVGDMAINGGALTATFTNVGSSVGTGGDVSVVTGGMLTAGSITGLIDNSLGGFLGTGGNILVNTGSDFSTTSGGVSLTIQNTDGTITTGGDLTLTVGNNLTTQALNLFIENFDGSANPAGHIGTGGNLLVTTGGDLTADSIDALINNRSGGMFDNGGNLTFNVGGALTTSGDTSFVISSRDDGGGGGTITQGGAIVLNLGSVSIGGELSAGMGLSQGGTDAEALATIVVSGNLTTGTDLFFDIQNGGLNANNVMTGGLIITNDVLLSLAAANVTTGDFLDVFINNLDGGQIGNNATVIFGVNGDVSIATDALWEIFNNTANGSVTSSIGSDATIAVTAGSISAGTLLGDIFNTGGATIGNDASLAFAVTGAITSVGNATFRIVNFDDGSGYGGGTIGGNADISIAAQSLSAATLLVRINNLGGTIGGNTTINLAIGGALTTTGNATINIIGDSLTTPSAAIFVTAASFDIAGALNSSIGAGTSFFNFDNVTINATNDITVGDQITVQGNVTAGGSISAVNGITIGGGSITAGGDLTSSAGSISQDFNASQFGNITVGGDISAAGGLFTGGDPTVVSAGGSVFAPGIITGELIAGNNITVDNTTGTFAFGLIANSTTAGGTLFMINSPTITPDNGSSDGSIGFTPHDFFLTAAAIVSTGPTFPLLYSNGSDADPTVGNDNPGNGGNVTLNLTAGGLTIGSVNDLIGIDANGGIFAADSTAGGNGGTINITATGDVTLLDGNISATSGIVPDFGTILGDGGTVNITTAGAITVNSSIEVSSNDSDSVPTRISISGGNISLTSTKATAGPAITVSNSGQLLALLNSDALGSGGQITLLATGDGGSSIDFNGFAEADRGTIDIRHTGANGIVNLGDATGQNFVQLFADVVKVGALGDNGVLTIGQGTLSADSTLALYGASANGEVHFVDSVSIGGQNLTVIAANTVTIDNNKVVTVNGARADVYTGFNSQGVPNANYSTAFGGNGQTTGTFAGAGANNPLPIDQAPPFDSFDAPHAPAAPATGPTTSTVTTAHIPPANPAPPVDRSAVAGVVRPRVNRPVAIARVANSSELLDLVDRVTSGATGGEPHRASAPSGRTSHRTGSESLGNGRSLPSAPSAATADPTLRRNEFRRPAALP